jgi:DNA transformation protein and related proteins
MDPEAIGDLFRDLGPVRTRRMFGGQGIYAGDLMFALEAGGELYLKADDGTVPAFQAAGSRLFTYEKDGRTAQMSY